MSFFYFPYLRTLVGDGRKGYAPGAPYDAIHVGAAAPILPKDVSRFLTTNIYFLFICVSFFSLLLN